jgi:hypothetical protein
MAVNGLEAIGTAQNYILAGTAEREAGVTEAAAISEKTG